MLEQQYTIINKQGLHARPAAMFVKTSNRFKSKIWVGKDGEQVNGKSIMGLMMLAAECGSTVSVSADGEDEVQALESIGVLIQNGFQEEP